MDDEYEEGVEFPEFRVTSITLQRLVSFAEQSSKGYDTSECPGDCLIALLACNLPSVNSCGRSFSRPCPFANPLYFLHI